MIASRTRPSLLPGIFRLSMTYLRSFSYTLTLEKGKPMPPRPSVTEKDIVEVFLKGSGPGGQKSKEPPKIGSKLIYPPTPKNKTASAVQLKHLPTGLVVKSQATRSREQNRKIARNILAMKLEDRFKGSESRTAKLRERDSKRKASKTKKSKRKYTRLEAEKATAVGENDSAGSEGAPAEMHSGPELGRETLEKLNGTPETTNTDIKKLL